MFALIPEDVRRLLVIGFDSSELRSFVDQKREVQVVVVEADLARAQKIEKLADRLIIESIDRLTVASFEDGEFDGIVLGNSLEKCLEPAALIRKCRIWLVDAGSLVIRVANSQHHSVLTGLCRGNWTYGATSLLDQSYIRCFARREIEKLIDVCGLKQLELQRLSRDGLREWQDAGHPRELQFDGVRLTGLSESDAADLFAEQFLFRAQPASQRDYGMTSIIIVTWNQLAHTRACVESVVMRTHRPYELIFVDNGSADGTLEYLQSFDKATLISNGSNRGFAAATNQGINAATGEQVLLLNNDCIVTTGWLDGLLEALHDDPANGLAGPLSNYVSGKQQIPVSYTHLSALDGFAWDQRKNRNLITTDRLVGFCLLVRRSALDDVGLLDEQFEVGCFEDDDLCRRAIDAGYRAIIASNVFVHHHGNATFRGADLDFDGIMRKNERRYRAKWGESTEVENRTAQSRLSLCMIVRDNENTIEACLASIRPWVDEIVIVDTGSTDRTPEICRQFDARMFDLPWTDDFSTARNESMKSATGDWIFWMDSDDIIPENQGRRLRKLVDGGHTEDCLGYVMQVHCPATDSGAMTIVDHVKLFRNRPELRFEHRIHEQILPSIRRASGNVVFTDIHVVHAGSDQTVEGQQRKLERDFRILKLDLEERPNHPFVLFNLGMTHENAGEYSLAETFLRRSIDVAGQNESHLAKAWALLVNCLRCQSRDRDAVEAASKGLTQFPDNQELLFRRGTAWQSLGMPERAIDDYRRLLISSTEPEFRSTDPGISGYKTRHNLALALNEIGQSNDAEACWRECIAGNPNFGPAYDSLVMLYQQADRLDDLQELASLIPNSPGTASVKARAQSLCFENSNEIEQAQAVLERAWTEHQDVDCLDNLARLLVIGNQNERARPILEQLLGLRPNDAAILHNLGNTLWATGHHSEAVARLKESLVIRPDAVHTAVRLAEFLTDRTQIVAARQVLKESHQRNPGNEQILSALSQLESISTSID